MGNKFKEEPTKSSFTCILAPIQQVYRNSAGETNTSGNRTRFLAREANLIDKGSFNVRQLARSLLHRLTNHSIHGRNVWEILQNRLVKVALGWIPPHLTKSQIGLKTFAIVIKEDILQGAFNKAERQKPAMGLNPRTQAGKQQFKQLPCCP